jgi:hypothetical protein
MIDIVLAHWLLRRSGCQAVQALPYCVEQELATAPPKLSWVKPFPDGENPETADVVPFVQM